MNTYEEDGLTIVTISAMLFGDDEPVNHEKIIREIRRLLNVDKEAKKDDDNTEE